VQSTNSNLAGAAPPANNRLPVPRITGNTNSRSVSIRSVWRSVSTRLQLPTPLSHRRSRGIPGELGERA
jgi:hypothetical protein